MSVGSEGPVRIVGRYALYGELASGGMATVHLGRLLGAVGFSRTVAIKRLHEQFAKDPEFVTMFLDEARLCARIRHPNVVPTLDVVATDRQLLLVMEYVQGESLSRLHRATLANGQRVPLRVVAGILSGVLHGLHAAHEAKDEHGDPLGIVHRDVSPQNVLVGADGVARVLDFGIAKAKGRLHTTQDGRVKGKLSYMAPEQLRSEIVDRRSDVFAASVIAWELCAGKRLFEAESEGATITKVLLNEVSKPSAVVAMETDPASQQRAKELEALDAIILRGLERDLKKRFDTAREMADAIEAACHSSTAAQVGAWVETVAADALALRNARVQEIESRSADVSQHVGEVIERITSEPDVTKTQNVSASAKIALPPSLASGEPATKAHEPVSKSGLAPPAPSRPWSKVALGAVLVAVLAAAAFELRPSATLPAGGTSAPASASSSSQDRPMASAPSSASASAATAPSASVPEAALPPATGSVATNSPEAGAKTAPTVKPPKPAATVDCRDPYTRDSLGRKIYKLECL
jgi:serine/threonine protein kinase